MTLYHPYCYAALLYSPDNSSTCARFLKVYARYSIIVRVIPARQLFTALVLFCCLAGCSATHVDLSNHALSQEKNGSTAVIKNIHYDAHGLPLFQPVLNKRPEKAGEQFTLVHRADGRPVKSFDILIAEETLDLERPRTVLYTWTGKGFDIGVALGHVTMEAGSRSSNKEGWIVVAAGAAMPIVGGIAGFVVGTWAILPEAMKDIQKLLTSTEILISFTEYAYDDQNRLVLIKMFQPGEKPLELVRTEFFYAKDARVPVQTKIISYPENKTRTLP